MLSLFGEIFISTTPSFPFASTFGSMQSKSRSATVTIYIRPRREETRPGIVRRVAVACVRLKLISRDALRDIPRAICERFAIESRAIRDRISGESRVIRERFSSDF